MKITWKDNSQINFTTHDQLDKFCQDIDVNNLPDEDDEWYNLLKGFDRAFRLRYEKTKEACYKELFTQSGHSLCPFGEATL